jgi:thiol-disulfide isomerase/thioredoxin
MKSSRTALALAAALACAAALRAKPVPPTPAPAWALRDPDGNVVRSDDFKGKVLVVDFWATWCRPCLGEFPGFTALQKKYGPDGLVIVALSVDSGGPAAVKKFLRRTPVGFRILMVDDKVIDAFGGMDGIPTTFIVDRNGMIRDRKYGQEKTADFEKRLLAYLAPGAP